MNLDYEALGSDPASYQNEFYRLQTFVGWPNPAVRPQDLAKAGFVYLNRDRVQCVYCTGILESWEEGDVPLEEHRKYFPRCPLFGSGSPSNQVPFLPRGIDVAGTGRPPNASHPRKKSVIVNKNVIPHHAPKHPKYGTLDSRLQSFDTWPATVNVSKNTKCMAEAGFFYTGITDYVLCFHCGQGLKEWKENDDPWEEHARSHPTCELILLKKGHVYVEKAKRKLSAATEITENKILTMVLDQSETEIKVQPKKLSMASIAMQLMKKTSLKESPAASNDMGPSAVNNETMEHELRSCILCIVQERCVTYLPCGHFSTCIDCTLMLSDCPVCRQNIDTVVKTYMS